MTHNTANLTTGRGLPPHLVYKADKLQASSLPVRDINQICLNAVKGYCANGAQCSQSHEICLLEHEQGLRPQIHARENVFSFQPRVFPKNSSPFDENKPENGPGQLSIHGPRHDNDFVDITDIRILPTADEMLCRRPLHMPERDFESEHRLTGAPRTLDTLFRQLRYDATEPLNDANYDAAQHLISARPIGADYDVRVKTPKGTLYKLYQDARMESTSFHGSKGVCVLVSFLCPYALRGPKLGCSNQLEEGRMVTVVGLDVKGQRISTTHMEIVERRSTKSMKLKTGNENRAAVVLSFVAGCDTEDVRRLLYNVRGILKERFVIAEVASVLYAGFGHTLQTLKNDQQQMEQVSLGTRGAFFETDADMCNVQDQYMDAEKFSFQDVVAPEVLPQSPTVALPSYADSDDFSFDLQSLNPKTLDGMTIRPRELVAFENAMDLAIEAIVKETSLDEGQARAICESLCRQLAFIQGAPGAGKSFLGVALVKLLLAQPSLSNSPKPILVVGYKNHTIDAFASDLAAEGVSGIVRLGTMSKQSWIKEFNIRTLARNFKKNASEFFAEKTARFDCEALWKEGTSWTDAINSGVPTPWPVIREHLAQTNVQHLISFTDLEMVEPKGHFDLSAARRTDGFAFEHWRSGGKLDDIDGMVANFATRARDTEWLDEKVDDEQSIVQRRAAALRARVEALKLTGAVTLWEMSQADRTRLLQEWAVAIDSRILPDKTAAIHERHAAARRAKRAVSDKVHLKIMSRQQIIVTTTTVAAREWKTLSRLGIRIVICEEAAEISEASFLSSLLPGLAHCICLGDPLQLRPKVTEKTLSIENDVGSHYRLDVSLMERLMMPADAVAIVLPASRLLTQRRMHTDMAEILRATCYPYLKDHADVEHRALPPGFVERIWWLDHREPENMLVDPVHPTSFNNNYEVEMVSGLVDMLVKSNQYKFQDITILTPYKGQLMAFYASLRSRCRLELEDDDRAALYQAGCLTDADMEEPSPAVQVGDMLRLATVDNFQGEESPVIILSLVRSNDHGQVGFIKSPNRINVALSRARNGLFIIGDSEAMRNGSNMWRIVIEHLDETGRLQPYIYVCCPQHYMVRQRISKPLDWDTMSQCFEACQYQDPKGLVCAKDCHADDDHQLVSPVDRRTGSVMKKFSMIDKMIEASMDEKSERMLSNSELVRWWQNNEKTGDANHDPMPDPTASIAEAEQLKIEDSQDHSKLERSVSTNGHGDSKPRNANVHPACIKLPSSRSTDSYDHPEQMNAEEDPSRIKLPNSRSTSSCNDSERLRAGVEPVRFKLSSSLSTEEYDCSEQLNAEGDSVAFEQLTRFSNTGHDGVEAQNGEPVEPGLVSQVAKSNGAAAPDYAMLTSGWKRPGHKVRTKARSRASTESSTDRPLEMMSYKEMMAVQAKENAKSKRQNTESSSSTGDSSDEPLEMMSHAE